MVLSHERAFAARLAVYIARAGRQAAQDHADGIDDPNLEDFAEALGNLLRPSMLTVARAFANRIRQSPKAAHAFEHKAFEEIDAALAEYVRTRSATRVTQITESLQRSIANIIRHGLTHRLSTEEVAANIVAATEGEMATARARRIAVTEMHSAANAGAYEAARQSGLEYVKEWVATEDNRTRADHAEAHGQRVALEDTFLVGDAELLYPGDPDGPPEQIINCFPGDTMVNGTAVAATRHWYEGGLVELATAGGRKLSGTPNHPVLTSRGWVPLKSLVQGDYVVCRTAADVGGVGDPHVDYADTSIEHVFNALAASGDLQRARARYVDFHGDRPAHDIDIVRPKRELMDGSEPTSNQHSHQLAFAGTLFAKAALLEVGALRKFFRAHCPSSRGILRSLRDRAALLGSGVSHALTQCFTPVAWAYAGVGQALDDRRPLDLHRNGDGFNGLPISKPSDDLRPDGISSSAPLGEKSRGSRPLNARPLNMKVQGRRVDIYALADVIQREPIAIEFDRVDALRLVEYAGHVFNLEAVCGSYIANDIVAHNCRCTVLYDPILEGADPRITRESEAYAGRKQPAEPQDQPQAILPAELLKELESFWRIMRETHTAVDTLEGYVDALLLGLTDKQETIETYVGKELPLEFREFLLDPRPIGVDYPPQDTFRGVGVIVKLTVPQGTPIDPVGPKPAVGGRIALRSDFDYSAVVTGVTVETWGAVLDDAGFDDELPPKVPGETRREREMRQDRARFVRRRRATKVIVISATLTATPRG